MQMIRTEEGKLCLPMQILSLLPKRERRKAFFIPSCDFLERRVERKYQERISLLFSGESETQRQPPLSCHLPHGICVLSSLSSLGLSVCQLQDLAEC